jgi:putative transposase
LAYSEDASHTSSAPKTERTARKVYRTRDYAKADVFDYVERFYNPKRRHATIG